MTDNGLENWFRRQIRCETNASKQRANARLIDGCVRRFPSFHTIWAKVLILLHFWLNFSLHSIAVSDFHSFALKQHFLIEFKANFQRIKSEPHF